MATGGLSKGTVTLQVAAVWTQPTQTPGARFATSSTGTLIASSTTITVTGIVLEAGGSFTITYSAPVPDAVTTTTLSAAEQSWPEGALARQAVSPVVSVTPCADGTGAMTVSPTRWLGLARAPLTFTYPSAGCGVQAGGQVTLAVPRRWPQPMQVPGAPGWTTLSGARTLLLSGMTIAAAPHASPPASASIHDTGTEPTLTVRIEPRAVGAITAIEDARP
ncbi:MAG: hypothetical protein ACLQDY_18665 [Streptosporangiaceae bacterium]|jgi:hypothetical protein